MSATSSLSRVILLLVLLLGGFSWAGSKGEQHRMEQILNLVSRDVRENFYDPTLKGLDWAALTEQARQRIENADEVGQMSGAISALVYALHDSHTVFIPPKRKFRAEYGFEAKPFADSILVYDIDKDGPAAKAGLQLGDQIVGVNHLNATPSSYFDMMRYLTVLDPREELDVEIADKGSTRVLKISASIIPMPPQYFFQSIEKGRDPKPQEPLHSAKDYDGGIAYLKLRSFVMPSTEMVGIMKPLKEAKAIIVDLRGNPGGSLDFMLDFLGHFTEQPFEMGQLISRKKPELIQVKPASPHIACPVFLLLDSASASASEMLARSMQIRKRAMVIGDRTSGSVNSARFFWEPPGQALSSLFAWEAVEFGTEIAVAKVVMEDGEVLEGRGVTPDELCVPSAKDLHAEKDPCLDQALARARTASAVTH